MPWGRGGEPRGSLAPSLWPAPRTPYPRPRPPLGAEAAEVWQSGHLVALGGGHGGRGCARAFGHCHVHTHSGIRVKVDPKSDHVWTRATASANAQPAGARVSGGWGRPGTFRGGDWGVVRPSGTCPLPDRGPPHTGPLLLLVPLSTGRKEGSSDWPGPF